MKKECAVVQDLLVLYEDDVLKEESRQMVEEHIRGCEECMQLYENARKPLPAIEKMPDSSGEEQEGAAVRVMKRLKKRITYKTILVLGAIVVLICFGLITINDICTRKIEGYQGLAETIYTLPAENFHVTELYQLKNGELYCTLESDKEFVTTQIADWILPEGKRTENTKEALKELRFRQGSLSNLNSAKQKETTVIFSLKRQGTVMENGKIRTITQSCADISVYGKTQKDKMTIWKAGQKVEEAPENIEKKAVRAYLQEGLYAKAVKECENMGWEDYEKIFGDTGLSWQTESGLSEPELTVTSECYSIFLN
ncbi:zf-HC2 domain-containing protein [Lachnospiraceae bacterium 42-17]|jgi:hypothetical protein|nr:zf-HC2 domain-containing protein [Dorea sp.]